MRGTVGLDGLPLGVAAHPVVLPRLGRTDRVEVPYTLFREQGLHPLPAPADFLIKRSRFDLTAAYPEADYLEKATVWFYETIGYVWAWLNGRV